MKKTLLTILSIVILTTTASFAATKASNSELASAIRLYKTADYAGCYTKLSNVIKKDPANALAYYYMAMTSAQIGKRKDALENYEKAITLAPLDSNLQKYAKRGKTCLESPAKCHEKVKETVDDAFITGPYASGFSDKARSEYERLKIENLMREMNRSNNIAPQEFREFKDFSSMNNEPAPTNDEIVAALRTLQRAGFGNILNNNYSELSLLTGNYPQSSLMGAIGSENLSPQLIQAMLTNNMSFGF